MVMVISKTLNSLFILSLQEIRTPAVCVVFGKIFGRRTRGWAVAESNSAEHNITIPIMIALIQ